jgi:hypothetical protein
MLRLRDLFSIFCLALLAISLLSCGTHDSNEYFVLVAANLQVPYWQAGAPALPRPEGSSRSAQIFLGPTPMTPKPSGTPLTRRCSKKLRAFFWVSPIRLC